MTVWLAQRPWQRPIWARSANALLLMLPCTRSSYTMQQERHFDMGRLSCRLEELSEARQSVVNKVKAAERDRDSLDGAKTVAEAYLGKERECAMAHASLYQIFLRDGQVSLRLHKSWFAVIMITPSLHFK